MRWFIGGVAATLFVVFGAGFLVVNRGWFPVGADNAPGSLERRIARMAKNAYISAHAPRQQNPVAPTEANLSEGARLYEKHCSVCHGGAARRVSVLRTKFHPPVPQIVNHVPRDPDAEFYWITKHGVRMTGMPAWDGILTDAQIWTVVAFIKHTDNLPAEARAAWRQAAGVSEIAAPVTRTAGRPVAGASR